MDNMIAQHVEIVDFAEHAAKLPVEIPAPVVHWLREHDVHDLKKLLLEMHSDGEDITEYAEVLSELEHLAKIEKLSGELPAKVDDDTNPLEYVDEEIEEALHA